MIWLGVFKRFLIRNNIEVFLCCCKRRFFMAILYKHVNLIFMLFFSVLPFSLLFGCYTGFHSELYVICDMESSNQICVSTMQETELKLNSIN